LIAAIVVPGFLPTSMPAYLRLRESKTIALKPRSCGNELYRYYEGNGERLEWTSSLDCGEDGTVKCFANGFPGYDFQLTPENTATINGRRVFFSIGNHGSNAWVCIPLVIQGRATMAVVGIWESNFLTPYQAMHLVAQARP
jgi:hypothetical protein